MGKRKQRARPYAPCHNLDEHDAHDWTASAFGVGDSIHLRCPGLTLLDDKLIVRGRADEIEEVLVDPPTSPSGVERADASQREVDWLRARLAFAEDAAERALSGLRNPSIIVQIEAERALQTFLTQPVPDWHIEAEARPEPSMGEIAEQLDTALGADREATPAEQERQDAMMHYHALADRYRHALERAADLLDRNQGQFRPGGLIDEVRGEIGEALAHDPRPGEPTDRYHWAHMKDGDKLIWRLVAELVELRDAQAVAVGAPTLKHHPSGPTGGYIYPLVMEERRDFWRDQAHRRGNLLWRARRRTERYRRALGELHVAHARSKKAERSMGRTITRLQADLQEAQDGWSKTIAERDALAIEGAAALEAERQNKLNAVRALRRAMRNAISALGSIRYDSASASTISGVEEHLREMLRQVIDPDDGGVH